MSKKAGPGLTGLALRVPKGEHFLGEEQLNGRKKRLL